MAVNSQAMSADSQPYRISSPVKKAFRSLFYGAALVGGMLSGGLTSLLTIGAATMYSGAKSASSIYKAFSSKYQEKSSSYFGKGVSYLARTIGTITVPWIQALASLGSGSGRIARNKHWPYDYPELGAYEAQLNQREAEALQQATRQPTQLARTPQGTE